MAIGTAFVCNNCGAMSLPRRLNFPKGVNQVETHAEVDALIIALHRNSWHDFFAGDSRVSEDFLPERASQ